MNKKIELEPKKTLNQVLYAYEKVRKKAFEEYKEWQKECVVKFLGPKYKPKKHGRFSGRGLLPASKRK